MKSYNHLYEKMISEENVRSAVRKASKGKHNRPKVRKLCENLDSEIPDIIAYAQNYRHRSKKPKTVIEGKKERRIIVPSYKEQILHHMLVNAMQPVIMKGMYEHCHGSIPGRGPAAAKRQIRSWIENDPRNVKYFLKMDIRQFFASIDHEMLKMHIRKRIHDERFLAVLFEVVDSTEQGLPLGFHTSHWLANWYLQGLDHYIKQELKAVHYVRYMDDMVIFGSSKKELHRIRWCVGEYLKGLKLELKGNWQVARFDRGGRYRFLDFMGYRFYRNRTTLRKGIMIRMTRRARRYKNNPTIYNCRRMMSALGWLKQTDSYDMYLDRIKPYINFQQLKRKISRYDRRIRKEQLCGEQQKEA